MLRIVQGVPGSGKSYYAVNYIYKNFCIDDDVYGVSLKSDVLLITNIEDIKLRHLNLDSLLQKYPDFFTVSNIETLISKNKNKHIIIVVDEAQRYFPVNYFNKDVFYFFQYHRHYGIDIILLTQSITTISKHLLVLVETIITASPRSISLGAFFRYSESLYLNYKLVKVNSFHIKKNKRVFSLYSSFKFDEHTKPKNFLLRYIFIIFLLFCFVVYGFMSFRSSLVHSNIKKHKKQHNKKSSFIPSDNSSNSTIKNKSPVKKNIPKYSNNKVFTYIYKGSYSDYIFLSIPDSRKVFKIPRDVIELNKCFRYSSFFVSCYRPLFTSSQVAMLKSLYPLESLDSPDSSHSKNSKKTYKFNQN